MKPIYYTSVTIRFLAPTTLPVEVLNVTGVQTDLSGWLIVSTEKIVRVYPMSVIAGVEGVLAPKDESVQTQPSVVDSDPGATNNMLVN